MSTDSQNSKSPTFHPAFVVSNINNHIKITLDTENIHYAHWTELFINTAKSFTVADHIVPPKADKPITKDAQWERLDAIVKQWIYSTISTNLLHTIITPGATAQILGTALPTSFKTTNTQEPSFSNGNLLVFIWNSTLLFRPTVSI